MSIVFASVPIAIGSAAISILKRLLHCVRNDVIINILCYDIQILGAIGKFFLNEEKKWNNTIFTDFTNTYVAAFVFLITFILIGFRNKRISRNFTDWNREKHLIGISYGWNFIKCLVCSY